jgi:hypothetical protein
MHNHPWRVRLGVALVFVLCSVSIAVAQAPQSGPAREAADAYLAYVGVIRKAAKLDEVRSHLSRQAREAIDEAAEDIEADELLGMIQAMMPKEITVAGATIEDDDVELNATGTFEGAPGTGIIQMVREEGIWKVGRESWRVR